MGTQPLPPPPKGAHSSPQLLRSMSIVANSRPSQQLLSSCFKCLWKGPIQSGEVKNNRQSKQATSEIASCERHDQSVLPDTGRRAINSRPIQVFHKMSPVALYCDMHLNNCTKKENSRLHGMNFLKISRKLPVQSATVSAAHRA